MEAVFGEYTSLSDVEIMGADDGALILDALNGDQGKPQNLVKQLAAVRRADPKAVAVREQIYSRMGIQTAGTPDQLFTAALPNQTLTVDCIRPMKFSAWAVPSEFARYFIATSAKIKGVDQFGSSYNQPLSCFSEVSVNVPKFRWGTINTSTPLKLGITCVDFVGVESRMFRSVFSGVALMD